MVAAHGRPRLCISRRYSPLATIRCALRKSHSGIAASYIPWFRGEALSDPPSAEVGCFSARPKFQGCPRSRANPSSEELGYGTVANVSGTRNTPSIDRFKLLGASEMCARTVLCVREGA